MSVYRVQVWCRDCLDDVQGCFDGASDFLRDDETDKIRDFATRAEAEEAARLWVDSQDGAPYETRVVAMVGFKAEGGGE